MGTLKHTQNPFQIDYSGVAFPSPKQVPWVLTHSQGQGSRITTTAVGSLLPLCLDILCNGDPNFLAAAGTGRSIVGMRDDEGCTYSKECLRFAFWVILYPEPYSNVFDGLQCSWLNANPSFDRLLGTFLRLARLIHVYYFGRVIYLWAGFVRCFKHQTSRIWGARKEGKESKMIKNEYSEHWLEDLEAFQDSFTKIESLLWGALRKGNYYAKRYCFIF